MTYRTRTIKRRRTKAEVEELDAQILDVLRADHPQSVRHIFYRMTNPRLPEPVEKSDHGYRHVQDRCVKLRRAGEIPYGWITDASRRGYFTNTYSSAGEFLSSVAGLYRADLWEQCKFYCEVWTESRSIAGVIQDDCEELAVSLYPAGGFSSISLAYQAAECINDEYNGREVVIFYIGDYDPAGVLIDVALEREGRICTKTLTLCSGGSRSRWSRSPNMTCRRSRAGTVTGARCISSRRSRRRPCLRTS